MKGCYVLKKFSIFLCFILIFSLCSCRKVNQTDNTNISNNSSIDTQSDFSATASDYVLPERDEPDNSTSNSSNSTNKQDYTSYVESDTPLEDVTDISLLNLETEKAMYDSSITTLTLVLYSKNSFTYYTDFFLQKLNNDKWEYVETRNKNIEYKFNIEKSEKSIEFITLDLYELYRLPLETGTYRIIQASDKGILISNEIEITQVEIQDYEY